MKLSLILIAGVMLTACSVNHPDKPLPRPVRESRNITIGTYNVFTGARDPDLTAKVIRRMKADVVLLQELSPQGAKLLDGKLRGDFKYRQFTEGVAILSRFQLKNVRYEHSQYGINGYLFAEVQSPVGPFQVASLHLDPLHIWTARDKCSLPMQLIWGQDVVHSKEVRQIAGALRPEMPTILGGDFNSLSGASIRQFDQLGYRDSFSSVNKMSNRTPTLHYELFGFNAGKRIDHILHDSSFHTIQSQVFPGAPSDHDPVVSVLGRR